jgi:hypothetical protein
MRRPRLGCLAFILAVIAFLALVITGAMKGAVFQAALTPVAEAEPVAATSQCVPVPAAAAASPSPSPAGSTAAAVRLCVSVRAGQDSVKGGQTATWSITVSAGGGSVPAVAVSLTSTPAAAFTSSCPSGGGTASCDLGDLATTLTPASYVLRAQVTAPAAGTLTLSAAATSPGMTIYPAAGQAITIVTPTKPKPAPARSTQTPEPTPEQQAATQAPDPVAGGEPSLGALPAYPVTATTTLPAENVASVLPVIAPAVPATATGITGTAGATTTATGPPGIPGPGQVASTPAADIQAVPGPASGDPRAGTFSLTIAMSARTAGIVGSVIIALVVVLATIRITTTRLNLPRSRRTPRSGRTPRSRRTAPGRQHLRRRRRPTRDERRAAREANWRRHLEGERKALPPPARLRIPVVANKHYFT